MEFGEAGGMEVGQAYAARVRAVNAAGPGPWSLDSDQMVARYKALKPKIVFNKTEKEFTFKVGDTMSFSEGEEMHLISSFTAKEMSALSMAK